MMTQAEREAIAATLNRVPGLQLAITLRYRQGPVHPDRMHRDLRDLAVKAERRHFGRHFTHVPPERRARYWAVVETPESNPHVHVGWACSNLQHARAIWSLLREGVWETRYAPGGTHDAQAYEHSGYGDHGWASYATKALKCCDFVMTSEGMNIAMTV